MMTLASYTSPVTLRERRPAAGVAKPTSGRRAESLQDKEAGEGAGSPATSHPFYHSEPKAAQAKDPGSFSAPETPR